MAFTYYSPLTVQAAQVPTTQANFPVLLRYTDNRFKTTGGHVLNANGYDLRPYSDSSLASALTYQLVEYDSSVGAFEMWVLVPSLSNGYVIYLGYGDAALSSDGSSSSTWPTSYKTVWHAKENAANTTVADSSQSVNTGTANRNTSNFIATGQIGGGFNFDRNQPDYVLGANTVNTANATVSIWCNIPTLQATRHISGFCEGNGGTVKDKYIYLDASFRPNFYIYDGTNINTDNTTTALVASTWTLLHGTTDGSNVKIYINGVLKGNVAGGASYASYSNPNILMGGRNSDNDSISGIYDEAHFLNVALTQDWITTEYNNQSSPSSFMALGTEVPVGGGGRFFILTHPA
jgi:hypothetical protein